MQFNVLWLNPGNNNTFPPGLIEATTLHNNGVIPFEEGATETVQTRMRKQMQADALQPLKNEDEEEGSSGKATTLAKRDSSVPLEVFPLDLLEEIAQFLRLQVSPNCNRRVPFYPGSDFSSSSLWFLSRKGSGPSSTCVGIPPR